jgi:hypothetical protein
VEKLMKSRNIISFIFLFLFIGTLTNTVVYAGPVIKSRSEIVGTWLLEWTALKKDRRGGNKEEATWDFRPDGTVVISGYNKFLKHTTTFNKGYEIVEESVIEVKDDTETTEYKVVEKGSDEMILKGPFGYYFFKKK